MPRILNVDIGKGEIGSLLVLPHAASLPPRSLLCDGSSLLIVDYPKLFTVISNVYGGDGVTNFLLPNYAGRCFLGSGLGPGLTNRTHGQFVTNFEYEGITLPKHTHSATISSSTATHQHSYNTLGQNGWASANTGGTFTRYRKWSEVGNPLIPKPLTGFKGAHSHSFFTPGHGNSGSHNNMQPSLVWKVVIMAV